MALLFAGVLRAVRFVRERIEVTVRPEAIDVDGLYVYRNPLPFPWTQGLRVPFPVDANHPAPATVGVLVTDPGSGADRRSIPVRWFRGQPHFAVQVPAFGETHVRVQFTQRSTTQSATYLLTTTRSWRRSLERGEYVLRPRGVEIRASNYPLDSPEPLGFVRENFMPEKEWNFSWVAR